MKKYLLTVLLGVFGLFGFASADSVIYTDGIPSPSSIYYVGNVNCDSENLGTCSIPINNVVSPLKYRVTDVYLDGEGLPINRPYGSNCSESCSSLILHIRQENVSDLVNGNFDYLLLKFGTFTNQTGTLSLSSNNFYTSLPSEGGDSSSTILSGGISQLSPVITSISSVMSEFIPYVVYIGIGILLVTLGFKAIKRLVNWLSSKITRYFK